MEDVCYYLNSDKKETILKLVRLLSTNKAKRNRL